MCRKSIWVSSSHISGNEMKYIKRAFDENLLTSFGTNIDGFEKDLENYLKSRFVCALNSGTSAVHLGLILLGVSSGDEVLCQSFTYFASAGPIIYQGATPVFVDSETDSWNLCPERLEDAVKDRIKKGRKPKAIVAVHSYGMPYKHEEIKFLSEKYEIPVLEDSAEALGSEYKGQKCGTLGDISVLSFNGNKIITTSGGGALVVKDKDLKEKAVFLATQARDNAPHYQHSQIGYNYRMSNIVAGIGRGQMETLPERLKARRANFEYYKEKLTGKIGITFVKEPEGFFSNRWLSCILTGSYEQREKIRLNLHSENVETRPLWKPMHLQPVFQKYPKYVNGVSEKLFETGLCLPSGSDLVKEDLDRIIENI